MPNINLPEGFVQRMQSELGGQEFLKFKKAIDQDSKSAIRLNPFKKPEMQIPGSRVDWSSLGWFLDKRPSFTLDPAFHAGAYYVQEASSMFLDHILKTVEADKEGVFLDLSAAPGGKSTLMSSYLGDSGLLIANEVIKSRATTLKENIIKWGLGNTIVTQNDPDHFEPLEGFFDVVLVDAPCSGEGMFRKDPQARNEWSQDHVNLCAARQERIMDKAGALVKAGGYLIYSTCTFNNQENEEMIRFIASEFSYQPVRIPLKKEWKIVESEISTEDGEFFGYRFYPHLVDGEGFFVSVMKRAEDAYIHEPKRTKDFKHPFIKSCPKQDLESIIEKFSLPQNTALYILNNSYFYVNADFRLHFEYITRFLNIRYFGVELGQVNNGQVIPSHEWALSVLPKSGFALLELDREAALDFLRKEDLHVPDLAEGWHLVTYQDLTLGWIKNLGNRLNNYYPKEWRIRMKK